MSFIPIAIVGLVSLGAVVTLGVFMIRKRLTSVTARKLPPSGARPWKLSRDASLHGNTNLYSGGGEAAWEEHLQRWAQERSLPDNQSFSAEGFSATDPGLSFPDPGFGSPVTGFASSDSGPAPTANDFIPASTLPQPFGQWRPEEIRREVLPNSGIFPAVNGDKQSLGEYSQGITPQEGMPSLDDPFLRKTLKDYIQRGQFARQQDDGG